MILLWYLLWYFLLQVVVSPETPLSLGAEGTVNVPEMTIPRQPELPFVGTNLQFLGIINKEGFIHMSNLEKNIVDKKKAKK